MDEENIGMVKGETNPPIWMLKGKMLNKGDNIVVKEAGEVIASVSGVTITEVQTVSKITAVFIDWEGNPPQGYGEVFKIT